VRKVFDFPLKHSKLTILIFVVASAFMAVGVSRLKINYSTESFSPRENPLFQRTSVVDETYNTGRTIIAILPADDVFAPDRLVALRSLSDQIAGMDGVIQVVSLANAHRLSDVDGTLVSSDMVAAGSGAPSPADIAGIKEYLAANYAMKGGLLASADGKTATLIVKMEHGLDENKMVDEIEAAIGKLWGGRFDISGAPVLGKEIFSVIKDVPLIALLSLTVILIFLALNFRSPLGVILPFVQLIVGLVWGVGLIGWAGTSFLALMAIAPIAILAVGSSFSLHLLGRYFLELSLGKDKETAIRDMVSETGLGVFVSGLAISVSMLTFLLSELDMIRGMGLLTAAGVFSCMLAALFLLPAILKLLPAPKVGAKSFGNGALSVWLGRLGQAVGARPKAILITGAVLVLASIFGVFRIVPDTSIVAYFQKDSEAIRGMRAIEKAFGGSTQLNVLVDGDLEDPVLLAEMLKFQEDARRVPGVGPAQSLATIVRTIHETLTGEAGMPTSRDLVSQELLVYQASGSVDDITSLANLNYTEGLVSLVVSQDSSRESKLLVALLGQLARQDMGDRAKIEVLGDGMTVSILEDIVLKDFIISLTLAIFLVFCIDSLIRSLRAALVTITVLIFTIALQYGVLGLFGIKFTMATALMGALAIGVGDYAIHLTVRYMEDRRKGLSPEKAIETAVATSGRSILFTSLTLGSGFAALAFSKFVPVAGLGGLMVFTVFAVGGASLTLLPAACLLFLRNPYSRMEVSHD
jgi:predicted RND superfamily exporter protein